MVAENTRVDKRRQTSLPEPDVQVYSVRGTSYRKRRIDGVIETEVSGAYVGQKVNNQRRTDLTREERQKRDRANSIRSAREARKRVRQTVRALGLHTLWSFTYGECVTDRERVLRDLDRWRRRIRKFRPGLEYLAVFELQKRGAIHVHVGVNEAVPHGMMWHCWSPKGYRAKKVDGTGYDFVQFEKPKSGDRWKPGKLSGYLCKYLSKDFNEGGVPRSGRQKRFTRSKNIDEYVHRFHQLFYTWDEVVGFLSNFDHVWVSEDLTQFAANNFRD